jgi:hypothetical protein
MVVSMVCRLAGVIAAGAILAACGGGGQTTPVVPGSPSFGAAPAAQSGGRSSVAVVTAPTPTPTPTPKPSPGTSCTPIVTVNPATQFPTRTAKSFSPGRFINLDATGCDYGIYLGPSVHHARIADSRVHGASRVEIIAEGADDVEISDSAIDGSGGLKGIEFDYGASGSIDRTYVTNTGTGINLIYGATGHVGLTLITNTSFIGINVLDNATGVIEDVLVDNQMNVGSGVAVQLGSKGTIRRTTAIGAGKPTAVGPQYGFFFGYSQPQVSITDSTAIHNEYGFGSYCVPGISSAADFTNAGDTARDSTVANYEVETNPALCPAPP